MKINWYPGHMTKAFRMMDESAKLVDVVLYLLDARIPISCMNEAYKKIIANKTIIYILNKCDLADEKKTNLWLQSFAKQNDIAIALDASKSFSAKPLLKLLEKVEKPKADRFQAKGAVIPTRVMVLGIPNSGKSTLINTLCGKKQATTGNKPGVTRGKQWVRLSNNIELLDTPGTLYPNFEDQVKAMRLAFVGSINDDILDLIELGTELLVEIKKLYPNYLYEKYGIAEDQGVDEMIEQICKKRGFLLKQGELDNERALKAVIDDFRKGRLGRISLESPNE